MKIVAGILALVLLLPAVAKGKKNNDLLTPFERSHGTETATYDEAVAYYKQLAAYSSHILVQEAGPTDAGRPLHVVYYTADGNFDRKRWQREGRVVLLINNDIHPGEPDGVDACMMLLRDAVNGKIAIPGNVALAVIPMYNIGGALNRNSYSRANQNGPVSYGFRGSAQNLDLNRDFIKCDAQETRSLEQLIRGLQPDVFIDNHVSDGADYQHIMTLLSTQHNKLSGSLGRYIRDVFTPAVYKDMNVRGYDVVPYVNDFDKTPDAGWREFYDLPRFSSGYAALFGIFAFVPETHMLKPFKERVYATYAIMNSFIAVASANAGEIKKVRAHAYDDLMSQQRFTLDWQVDTARCDSILFKGYTPGYKPSAVSGLPRLYYDHDKPFTKQVPFYNQYMPVKSVTAPKAYIIPRGWQAVAGILRNSGVHMAQIAHDTDITVTAYHIDNFETGQRTYEKHYMHKQVQVTPAAAILHFLKGDYVVDVAQPAKRYIIETLEPTAPDAFFAWGFFDAILQQKEYYSDYVFEDVAAQLLNSDAGLRALLEDKRKQDTAFAKSAHAQLDFVYRHSSYLEPGYMRYPVYRVE